MKLWSYDAFSKDKGDPYANSEYATVSLFGGKTAKEMLGGSGNFANRKVYDPESGKVFQGMEFWDSMLKPALEQLQGDKDASSQIRVTGELSPEHPLSLLTGDGAFGVSSQLVINGRPVYISGPAFSGSPLWAHTQDANSVYTKLRYEIPGADVDISDRFGLNRGSVIGRFDKNNKTGQEFYYFTVNGKKSGAFNSFTNAYKSTLNYLTQLGLK